jgi:NitT/TauT family transport system permease protein
VSALLTAFTPTGLMLLSVLIGGYALVLSGRARFAAAAPLAYGVLVLWLWQVACVGYGVPTVLLPPPSGIALAVAAHVPTLGADFVQTFVRAVVPGYVIGNAAGLLIALLLARSDFLRRGVLPLSSLAAAMPIVGIAPIMVMWFGFDWQSKAAVVVLMTVFPMLLNATAGLSETGAVERDLMRSYAASGWQDLCKLRLPAALPFVFTALKLNATLALIGAIVAEFFGTPIVGIGFRISTEVARMNLDVVWAEIALAAACGCASYALLTLAERAVTFWHPSVRG